VIEAAAMGRATVAFAGGGIPEVVEDQRTGWLVRDHTAVGFACAMKEVGDRASAEIFGGNARKRAVELFDLDRMCREYGTIYGELTKRARQVNGPAPGE
jgi:glycosyltransferase involved in cell wall biosynthesis